MASAATLGEFEQLVLLAVLRLGRDAYGASVTLELESQGGRVVSVAAVHTTLDRLEQKGCLDARLGEPTAERGGKRKKYFRVTALGQRALKASLAAIRSLTVGLSRELQL